MAILDKLRLVHVNSFPIMMEYIAALLRGITININKRHVKPIPKLFYILNAIAVACYFYAYFLSVLWFIFIRCPNTEGDKTICFLEFSLAVCSVSPIMMVIYMKLHANAIMNLVNKFLECDHLVVQKTRFASNVSKTLRIIKKRAMILLTAFFVNGFIYITLPYLIPGRHLTEDMFVIYGLEPLLESPNYEIASAVTLPAIAYGVITLTITTIFIIIIIGYIEAQLRALGEELLNLWSNSEKFLEYLEIYNYSSINSHFNIRNMFIKNRLRDIIKFHINIINLHNMFEKGFRIIYLIKFMFIFSAIVAELLCGLENSNLALTYTFNQLFLDCFIGQRLIDASLFFEEALYNCKWENFDVSNQKTVLLMLTNSQKTSRLSAGGIAVLDYPTLMYIIRSTYSVYTTLQSTLQ